jgi:RDD family protein
MMPVMSSAETQAIPPRPHIGREPNTTERVRELVTPEGIDLRLRLAEVSERTAAFFIDVAIIVGVLIGMTLLSFLTMVSVGLSSVQVSVIIWMLVSFFLRNFYFMAFELTPRGATPGPSVSTPSSRAMRCASSSCSCR